MKLFSVVLFSFYLISSRQVIGQSNFKWQKDKLILDNGVIERTIELDKENQTIGTRSIYHNKNEINFVSSKVSKEYFLKCKNKIKYYKL